MKAGSYLSEVRDQYENYPYPARQPSDELQKIFVSKSCSLDCLNHHCFEGKQTFDEGFRVLVAGGGTGDDVVYLAEQLRGKQAEIVYVDMSESSMNIAKERAKVRKLDNITWFHDSLLNLEEEKFGLFDFITCTGVLHHLEDPDAGLAALTRVLKPEGAMYLMVYATIGRTGIYQMQELMRRINNGVSESQQKVDNTKRVLANLPPGNWFSFNKISCKKDLSSDIGIYDLLLHSTDRAYTVSEMYEFVEQAGLTLSKLYNPDHPLGDFVFYPDTYLRDPQLLAHIKSLPVREQQAVSELLFGQLMKQCCFVSKKPKNAPSLDDQAMIPCISTIYTQPQLVQQLQSAFQATNTDIPINPMFSIKNRGNTVALFHNIDGKRSLKDIVEETIQQSGKDQDYKQVYAELRALLDTLIKVDIVYLKDASVFDYPTIPEMIQRVRS